MNFIKPFILSVVFLCLTFAIQAQNVGVGQTNPTNTLHVTPQNTTDDPLRIDDLQYFTPTDTSLVVIDKQTGIVRYMNPSDLKSILNVDYTTGPGITISNDTIYLDLAAGSGISISGNTITNTAPDIPVSVTGTGATTISGTYPNFTVNSTDNVNDADAVIGNEYNTSVTLTGSKLNVTDGGGTKSVTLTDFEGDIKGVTAGAGLTGGGTTGSVTLTAAANNGLNVDAAADRIQLGGALTETTTISNGSYNMAYNMNGTGDFLIQKNGSQRVGHLDNGTSYILGGGVGIGTTTPTYKMDVVGGSLLVNGGWVRIKGNNGVYFQDHGGGFRMAEGTWIRTYGGKSFYHDTGLMRTDGTFQVGGTGATLSVANGGNFAYRTNVLFANTSGNVGIGTASPAQRLHVNGTVRVSSLVGQGNRMVIATPSGDLQMQGIPVPGAGLFSINTPQTATLNVVADNGLTVGSSVQLGGYLNKNTDIEFFGSNLSYNLNGTGDFLVQDNGTTRFAMLDNGRITVGSTDNAGRFNVTGNSYFSNDIVLRDGTVTAGNLIRLYDSSDDGRIDVYQGGLVANRINGNGNSYITGGNFGVGRTAPVHPFHAYSNNSGVTAFVENYENLSTTNVGIKTDAAGGGTGENIGIMTHGVATSSASGAKGVIAEAEGQCTRKIGVDTDATNDNASAYAYGIWAYTRNAGGIAGGGAQYAGFFSGNVYSTGSYLPSFEGLKKNVRQASPAMQRLLQLDIKEYEFRTGQFDHMNLPKGKQTGVLAGQMKKLYPELVEKAVQPAESKEKIAEDEITFDAVNYTGLIPHLVKGTQEHHEVIETILEENTVLKSKVEKLENELELIKKALQLNESFEAKHEKQEVGGK